MTQEEKAKAYDEAIERAKDFMNGEVHYALKKGENITCWIFPELRESEDERIRKALMQNLKERFGIKGNMGEGLNMPDVLAWLEKQGEQKPVVDDKDAEKASEEYRNFRMSCGIKDPVMLNEIEEAYYEGAIRKQKAAWSEEDERICQCLIQDQEEAFDKVSNDKYGHSEIISDLEEMYRERIAFLKSLKDRVQPQPKQKWSEEDKEQLDRALYMMEQLDMTKSWDDVYNWLKSLRPQSQWKPSDEHYELEEFAKIVRGNLTGISKTVQKLFEDKYLQLTGNKMYGGFKD